MQQQEMQENGLAGDNGLEDVTHPHAHITVLLRAPKGYVSRRGSTMRGRDTDNLRDTGSWMPPAAYLCRWAVLFIT